MSREHLGRRLTNDQKHELLLMGERSKFALSKACRVLGESVDTLTNMIYREEGAFIKAAELAFPAGLQHLDEKLGPVGFQVVRYEDLGDVKVPTTLSTRLATQLWDRNVDTGIIIDVA